MRTRWHVIFTTMTLAGAVTIVGFALRATWEKWALTAFVVLWTLSILVERRIDTGVQVDKSIFPGYWKLFAVRYQNVFFFFFFALLTIQAWSAPHPWSWNQLRWMIDISGFAGIMALTVCWIMLKRPIRQK